MEARGGAIGPWASLLILVMSALVPVPASFATAAQAPPEAAAAGTPAREKIETLRGAVAVEPWNAAGHYRLALALRSAGVREEALDHFRAAVTLGPATRERLIDLGVACSSLSHFDEAITAYRRALELSPEDPIALENLASIAYLKGEMESSVELYRRAVAGAPDDLVAHYRLGHALKFLGRNDEAYTEYRRVIALDPSNPREAQHRLDSLYHMATIDMVRGDLERATTLLRKVIEIAPSHPGAHYALGQSLLRMGKNAEALAELQTHMDILRRRAGLDMVVASPE